MHSSVIFCGDALRTFSTGVSQENKFHTSQAVFFPRPLKDGIISHPVGTWNIGRVKALSGPRDIAMASAKIFFTFFPDLQVIQSSSLGRVLATEIVSTTSVSLFLIQFYRCPLGAASSTWTVRRVFSSSCVQGTSKLISVLSVLNGIPLSQAEQMLLPLRTFSETTLNNMNIIICD